MKRFLCGLKYIFISFLCIFLMSHNAGAIDVSDSSTVVLFGSSNPTCRYLMDSSIYSNWTNDVSPTFGINVDYSYIDTWQCRAGNSSSNFSLKADDIVEVYWWVRDNDPISNDSYYQGSGALQRWQYDANFRIVSAEIVGQISNINDRYTYWRGILVLNNDFTGSSITVPVQQSTTNIPSSQTSWVRTLGWTAYRAKSGTDYSSALNNIQNKIDNLNNSIENQNQEETDAVQDAADDSSTAGQDSSDEAASATTGFISAISGFVSAITNASPSNCNINANLNHLNLGVLDLCSMPVPSYITIIGSIIAIMLVIPFCIVMFNRFIGLFRSFQG